MKFLARSSPISCCRVDVNSFDRSLFPPIISLRRLINALPLTFSWTRNTRWRCKVNIVALLKHLQRVHVSFSVTSRSTPNLCVMRRREVYSRHIRHDFFPRKSAYGKGSRSKKDGTQSSIKCNTLECSKSYARGKHNFIRRARKIRLRGRQIKQNFHTVCSSRFLFPQQIITPTRSLVLGAENRKEMEDWCQAMKSAAAREFFEPTPDQHDFLSGYHHWYATSHARPTYCNVSFN